MYVLDVPTLSFNKEGEVCTDTDNTSSFRLLGIPNNMIIKINKTGQCNPSNHCI